MSWPKTRRWQFGARRTLSGTREEMKSRSPKATDESGSISQRRQEFAANSEIKPKRAQPPVFPLPAGTDRRRRLPSTEKRRFLKRACVFDWLAIEGGLVPSSREMTSLPHLRLFIPPLFTGGGRRRVIQTTKEWPPTLDREKEGESRVPLRGDMAIAKITHKTFWLSLILLAIYTS